MSVELEDRLTDLFERTAGAVVVDEELHRVLDAAPPRRRRVWMPAVAAAAVVLVGSGALIVIANVGDDPERTVSQQPADPPGPLYVLPEGLEGWVASNGYASSGDVVGEPTQGVIIARPIGDHWVDPVQVIVGVSLASRALDAEPVELSTGVAHVYEDGHAAWQQRGDQLLLTYSDTGDTPAMLRALEDLQLDADGSPTLSAGSSLDVIGSYQFSSPQHTTYYELHSLGSDFIDVETSNASGPLGGFGSRSDAQLSRFPRIGVDGWHITAEDVDGEWHAIAWMATPHRVVAVSGHVPFETVRRVAESLVIVDEETWIAVTNCECGQTPVSSGS